MFAAEQGLIELNRVIPAKAGIVVAVAQAAKQGSPAFAGMTRRMGLKFLGDVTPERTR